MLHRCCASLFVALTLVGVAPAAAPIPRAVSFRDDVFPILSRHCLRCHQGNNPTSGVRLDTRAEILGENNGRAIAIIGEAGKSRLLAVVRGDVRDKVMPPEGRGKRLTAEQINILSKWIDSGMAWDDRVLPPPPPPKHRFFRAVVRPEVPHVADARTPIGAFLSVARKANGLRPVAEASRRVLIRRLHLNLIGLPPTPNEIDVFVRDSSPDAYERLVERLLASPAYGERWGRHWLDVARYAESEGYESNHLRPHAWRYRDWVVGAFNADMPFATFVRLQLAGDEVRPYSDDNLIATGFLAAARHSSNEEDKQRQRNDILVDIVNTTASAFLGLTFNCAQCHNHKFDPITARDYYRLQAFFIRGQPGNLALTDPLLQKKWRASLPAGYEQASKRRDEILESTRARLVAALTKTLPDDERRALQMDPDKRSAEQERLARLAEVKLQYSSGRLEREIPQAERKEYDTLKKRLLAWEKTVPDEPQTFGYVSPVTSASSVRVLPMKGFYPLPYEADRVKKLRSRLLVGGDVHNWGPALEPGWPTLLGSMPKTMTPTPRQALAAWIAATSHPLAARVWVNRIWQGHFGRGLVATSGDFGLKGSPPSHPELLDWLAAEFIASGGSTKHIHRLIVRSDAYRMSSTPDADNAAIDAENVFLWRWKPRRLEAETIRDCMLSASGDLDARMGGPGDADETASWRRGVYLFQKRDHPAMVNGLFDGPSASAESCPKRSVSTVPLQALYLLNNRFSRERAESLAARVRKQASDREGQVTATFRLALGRTPDEAELRACERFFDRHGDGALVAFCQAVLNLNEFVYLE